MWFGPASPVGVLLGVYGTVVMVATVSQRGAGFGTLVAGLVVTVLVALAVARVSPVAWVCHVATGLVCGIAGLALLNLSVGNWAALL